MKFTATLAAAAAVDGVSAYVVGHSSPQSHDPPALADLLNSDLSIRSTPSNQPNGYGPTIGQCPDFAPTIRSATGLSSQESAWLAKRRPNTLSAMMDLLNRANITGFNATQYINTYTNNVTALPNIAIAASGGGYRAMLNGAGAISAFDSRSTNSTATGQLGGLLQASTYFAGLSGGSWLVGSVYGNNFTTIQNLQSGAGDSGTWDFTNSILEGPNKGFQLLTTADYYRHLVDQVDAKSGEDFNITLTDYWGRALSYQLINATDGGPAYTWSSIATQSFFTNAEVPFPIIIADGRAPGETDIPSNTTIFEFNPYEFGTWDPTVYAFAPMEYVGTNFSNGNVVDNSRCVTGFDNIGFTYGTSSTLFNQIVLQFNTTVSLPSFFETAIQDALDKFGESDNDVASYPNPFVGIHPSTNRGATSAGLTLVDGGEDGENIPLHPLIQPYRAVDTIFAIDSSADVNNWPNGTSLVATYQRSLSSIQNLTNFPAVPDENTFVNLGLNKRPTFFGCSGTNNTHAGSTSPPPLVVYLPNAPYSFDSNVSTYDLSYSDTERDQIITNGWNVATRGNASTETWPTCVGCAIMRRSWERTNTTFPAVCNTCFTDYCWNGTVNSTTPKSYMPTYILSTAKSAASDGVVPQVAMVIGAAAVAAFALMA